MPTSAELAAQEVARTRLPDIRSAALKSKNVATLCLHLVAACQNLVDFHDAHDDGTFGSGGPLSGDDLEREAALKALVDDENGYIREGSVSRKDYVDMIALARNIVALAQDASIPEGQGRSFLVQRVGG